MFDHIQGELVSKTPTQAVISAGGVGYAFTIPLSTFDALPPRGAARLLVHLHVREDALKLYGFATEDERRLFTQLISISGIGPTTAVTILNGISVEDFRQAVAGEQAALLCKVKGVGRKTAERIIVELKAEMEREIIERPAGRKTDIVLTADAVAAMTALGYTRSAAENAVARAVEKLGRQAPLEELVREALRHA
jgi:Holliday junction DNA helicase RuvA